MYGKEQQSALLPSPKKKNVSTPPPPINSETSSGRQRKKSFDATKMEPAIAKRPRSYSITAGKSVAETLKKNFAKTMASAFADYIIAMTEKKYKENFKYSKEEEEEEEEEQEQEQQQQQTTRSITKQRATKQIKKNKVNQMLLGIIS